MRSKVIVGLVIVAFLTIGVGLAQAGQFTSAKDLAKVAAIDQDLATTKKAIAQRYDRDAKQLELGQRMAVQAATVATVADDGVVPAGRPFRRMLTGGVKAIFTGFGSCLVGAEKGVKYVGDSPLENPLSRFCRGVNVALDQTFGNTVGCAAEVVTPWSTEVYADPSQLNPLAAETITWGPLAQIGRTASYTVPTGMLATCSLPAIYGVSQSGSMLIYGSSGYVVGAALSKGVDFAEKYGTKAVFKK